MNILPSLPSLSSLSQLPWRKSAPPARRASAAAPAPTDEEIPQPGWGCGWFDSSHELQQGLLVHESGSVGALAAELPLDLWLDWYGSCPAAAPGAAQ